MLNKLITLVVLTIIALKIYFWIITNSPISRLSVIVLILLLAILNFKNKSFWYLGLIFFSISILSIIINLNIYQSDSWNLNPFLFLQSIENSLQNKSNSIVTILFNIFPLILYVTLFLLFITPNYRKEYLK